ncbi:hypothetical protein MACH01_07740 [Thalassospira tepidiphila]|nr:hypothetical protein AUQ41_06380 [Thalassospira sp. MCCC 1A02898]ONH87325.1 hypothetical protein TH47_13355 [Thalassospira sp. MCCC 1A02803]BDW88007.1 hypothetical protein MACH01_07740 [Thalassospira tepidiphila]
MNIKLTRKFKWLARAQHYATEIGHEYIGLESNRNLGFLRATRIDSRCWLMVSKVLKKEGPD